MAGEELGSEENAEAQGFSNTYSELDDASVGEGLSPGELGEAKKFIREERHLQSSSERIKEDFEHAQETAGALKKSANHMGMLHMDETAVALSKQAEFMRSQASEAGQDTTRLENMRKANLLDAKEHVDEHLPEYKQTAAEEMKVETGREFNPAVNDAEPPVVGPPAGPETT